VIDKLNEDTDEEIDDDLKQKLNDKKSNYYYYRMLYEKKPQNLLVEKPTLTVENGKSIYSSIH
jgi:hypothetical protein